ncbi:MAG: 3-deoxy-D-manno-octulosonic acid transferase [Bacteroidales bacterium]|nr:3-deoxy-D-manno-octulosonic acid transferase [Bacteroidales bacterium]
MRFLYNIFIQLYRAGIAAAALFNAKARSLHQGRKETFRILKQCEGKKIIWFHCASLGEYEQGKPLIQKLRDSHSDCTFLVTFFSPSGYEVKKDDKDIDIAAYLPADTPRLARRFIQTVRPQAAFFVKYEYWFNFMKELSDNRIPFYYLSAIFRPQQYFFKSYGKWFARQLRLCTHFFVQNETSIRLLHQIGIDQATVTGDTRFDRVYAIARQHTPLDFMESFANGRRLLVAGSSWQPDEEVLARIFPHLKGYKLLIAPHVINKEHIEHIKNLFSSHHTICYSNMNEQELPSADVLILDTIGLLSKVYKYADTAMIGGAFATGLHNTLEAAVYGIPLFFGPHFDKFNEAVELARRQGAFPINQAEEMLEILLRFDEEPDFYHCTCQICSTYVEENLGACDKIMQVLSQQTFKM